MNIETATKTQIHAAINVIREIFGDRPLAAYKAKDLSKDELVEMLNVHQAVLAEFNAEREANMVPVDPEIDGFDDADAAQEDAAEELDPATTQPKRGSRYNEAGLRRCGCCGEYFETSEFGKYDRSSDGLASYTKAHTNRYRKGNR